MRCWRRGIQRDFSLYLQGELSSEEMKRLEAHLMDCGRCRARFARLRDGHRFAQMLPRIAPRNDGWNAVASALEADTAQRSTAEVSPLRPGAWRRRLIAKPRFAALLTAASLLSLAALVLSARLLWPNQREEMAGTIGALNTGDFHAVTISDIKHNTKPHVVAEGYVSELRLDRDGDLVFKLVEDLERPDPFIICEIIDSIRLEPPPVGSLVRVYGVSRYDGQAGREWYEVHPVLSIEMVRR